MLEGRRVLVVDDNATNRLILERQMAAWGMEADQAEDGQQALALYDRAGADHHPYELVVLDMHMPEMDGLHLAQEISARGGTAPPMVLLTSGGEVETSEARAAGVMALLTKPVRQSQLHDTLLQAVAGRRPTTGLSSRSPNPPANRRRGAGCSWWRTTRSTSGWRRASSPSSGTPSTSCATGRRPSTRSPPSATARC